MSDIILFNNNIGKEIWILKSRFIFSCFKKLFIKYIFLKC